MRRRVSGSPRALPLAALLSVALLAAATADAAEPSAAGPNDEVIHLDIVERTIEEGEYRASTALEAEGDGVAVRAGVAVSARRLVVRLFGVRGEVRLETVPGALEAVLPRGGGGAPPSSG